MSKIKNVCHVPTKLLLLHLERQLIVYPLMTFIPAPKLIFIYFLIYHLNGELTVTSFIEQNVSQ